MNGLIKRKNGIDKIMKDSLFNFTRIDKSNFDMGWDEVFKNFASIDANNQFGSIYRADDGSLNYTLDVPGCGKENVSVELEGDLLIIDAKCYIDGMGERKISDKLRFSLERYDPQLIEAEVKNGVLRITIQKNETQKEEKKRKIL